MKRVKVFIESKKHQIVITLVMMVMLTLITACGSTNNTGEITNNNGNANNGEQVGSDNNSSSTPKRDPQERVKITFYNPSNANATLESFLSSNHGQAITKKFPFVDINLIATGAGTTPEEVLIVEPNLDIIINSVFSYPILKETNLLHDITGLIKQYNVNLNRFEPTAIEFQRKVGNGEIYGLPVAVTTASLFYNKDIFEKFGVDYPTDDMTWDEVYELAKKLTREEGGTKYYGFATRYPFMYNTNQLSLSYYDPVADKVTINNDPFRMFIENFARFSLIPGNENVTTDMFSKEQTVAMMAFQIGNWEMENWDMASLPSFEHLPGVGPQAYSTYWNISSASKNKELAFEILMHITSDEHQKQVAREGSFPGLITPEVVQAFGLDADGTNGTRDLREKNVNAFFPRVRAESNNVTVYDSVIAKHMNNAFNAVAKGEKDSITALREAEDAANKEVAAMKVK